jgi:GntR family transcriptional regulator
MYITIDETDHRPLYRQVVDEIKALIARGELEAGSSLPPVRQVAADLGVNLNTIAFAYRTLQKEGLIKVRHGSGAVVTATTLGEKTQEQLRTRLSTALTHLVLAGLKRSEIRTLVDSELNELLRDSGR